MTKTIFDLVNNLLSAVLLDTDTIISALGSKSRRKILKALLKYYGYPSNALTLRELIFELKQDPTFKITRRESVYKALQTLVDSGLVEKRYEKSRGICYKAIRTKIEIDLTEGEIK